MQVQRELDEQQQKKQQQQEQEFTSQHHQRAGECSQLSQKSYFLEQQQQQPTTASQNPSSGQLESPTRRADPFSLVRDEIEAVSERLRRSILTDIPSLEKAAEYFFRAGAEGKRLRSTVLLLLATSLSASPLQPVHLTVDDSPPAVHPQDQRRRQQRLAGVGVSAGGHGPGTGHAIARPFSPVCQGLAMLSLRWSLLNWVWVALSCPSLCCRQFLGWDPFGIRRILAFLG